jgi:hypothetical protein
MENFSVFHWIIIAVMGLVVLAIPVVVIALIIKAVTKKPAPPRQMPAMLRCRACGQLSPETQKFCGTCGGQL